MDELYIIARQVLLDVLEALGEHRSAVILVGAQAVYLRVGEADLAVAPFTTDSDLAIDPSLLGEIPPLEQALRSAGFKPRTRDSVGEWITPRATSYGSSAEVAVDLLVPASASPGQGRRAARLPGHDTRVARIVRGLDGALVDADLMTLGSLEAADSRTYDLRVAGPAALLVAKLHKIHERHGTPRQSDKDALDVLRLLRGTTTEQLAVRYEQLLADGRSREPSETALALLQQQFATRHGIGVEMALRSVGPLAEPAEIAASCQMLATDFLRSVGR